MNRCKRSAIIVLCVSVVMLAATSSLRLLRGDDYFRGLWLGLCIGGIFLALMLWWSSGSMRDSAVPALARRYYRELGPPMLIYVAVMLCWRRLLSSVETDWARVLIALLPALLVALVIRAVTRFVRDSDEMQRRIELESIAIAAALVSGGYMTAGFLQAAGTIAVPATVAMMWVFPLLCATYGIAKGVNARRYQ
ncbi:hypothetical protein QSH18_01545 [Xanthomonas sp. NCPPB 2654]|uniref:hypothetical protein n=1 Tax=unclassified Xanthomonas TaxID=2643310 RepID=UPI0021E00ECE|nr:MULTISPECIES: hypothetical protein [unclassified Xanthomonas]MDL5364281.1 hypothetical protein [Xanthomonas sp. NCPPB 2654]UYC20424.1 hypothetical protein NUG20_20110 [Xanthomonas sp. CFBP 8443]